MIDLIVVGGGASGMVAAIAAARKNCSVCILEKNRKLGKKLLATGNGKCNFTNAIQNQTCYRSSDRKRAFEIIEKFPFSKTVSFFEELGMKPFIRDGYYYPNSLEAGAVVSILTDELTRLLVKCKTNVPVTSIEPTDSGFFVHTDGYTYQAKHVLLACGGSAAKVHGTCGDGYHMAKKLGHILKEPTPALTGLVSGDEAVFLLAGLRIRAKATLSCNGIQEQSEEGEIQFTSYGISGIPIMQLSRYAADSLNSGKKTEIILNLFSDKTQESIKEELLRRIRQIGYKSGKSFFIGLLADKLAGVFVKKLSFLQEKARNWTDTQIEELVSMLVSFRIPISKVRPFEEAQTTAGGVLLSECNDFLESKRIPGLFFSGEILDVDGACGGYNLQWAWTTGYLVGREIAKRKE